MADFEVYRARLTPQLLGMDRYSDPHTGYSFGMETGYRLKHMASELVRIGGKMQISPDKRMFTVKGSVPTDYGRVEFYLAGFMDVEKADDPERYSCEVEIALATNSPRQFNWVKEQLENELPAEIVVGRELKYIKVEERSDGIPDIKFADYLTV
ncbi:MAG: hypothetical protein HY051_05635 [Candidatus Aenigmarchaeota archaeon]|nr:hypothetical protein [Candidatus Aenigmarchaeota archaeon]